jgi:uncharacterized protein YaaR (DUF327 family)
MGIKIGKKQSLNLEKHMSSAPIYRKESPFQPYLNEQERTEGDPLPLLKEIEEQGHRLAQSLTVKDLRLYKQLIQKFIKEAVAGGVSLKSTRVWHRPQSHAHSILNVVDQTLIKLTDDILKREVDPVSVLEHIGEIKGLLIDLYQ